MEALFDIIEGGIYDDLASSQRSNAYQSSLPALGLSDRYNNMVNRAARRLMLQRVKAIEQDQDYDDAALPHLQSWLRESLLATLQQWKSDQVEAMHSRLDYEICIELGRIRSRQLFDIIKEYPQSTPALEDLNACGEQCSLQPYISQQLSTSLEARLLHPGASTKDIIQFYTHLIRALRYIDPSGVILSHVIGPVRTYLRARPDTISVIVASLLGQAGDFTLLRDMMRETDETQGLHAADTSLMVYDEEDDTGNAGQNSIALNSMKTDESKRMVVIPSPDEQDWAPRPVNAGPDYRQSRKSDVIAIIVSIFDDEEGFVSALEKSCAEQLIKIDTYDTSKEYETNENLKKRFGDAPLSKCDVMLNDIKKSQRYNRAIHHAHNADQEKGKAFHKLHPFILSRQFWPPLKEAVPIPAIAPSSMFTSLPASSTPLASTTATNTGDNVKMPGQFAKALEEYQDSFKKLAPMRRLRWMNARSSVTLSLQMNDGRKIRVIVTPLQAAVVEVAASVGASKQQPLSISLLMTELQVSKEAIMEAVLFWCGKGILKAIEGDTTSYEIIENVH